MLSMVNLWQKGLLPSDIALQNPAVHFVVECAEDWELAVNSSTPMAAVSKVCYEAWEKDVIAAFYTSDNLQSDFRPRDGCLAVVSEEKVVLVVLEGDRRVADMVSFAVETNLPAKSQSQLFHIGKEQVDGVFYGLAENGEFVHPAIDFEGLINYQQKLVDTQAFIQGKQVVVQLHCDWNF